MPEIKHNLWKGKTDGTPWMHKTLIWLMRWINLNVFYGIMALVVPFYMIFNKQGYRSTYNFFRNRMGYPSLKSFFSVYVNHFRFGQVILDRFAVFAGKSFHFDIENYSLYESLSNSDKGFIMLGSHVGNYEMAGYSLVAEKTINALHFNGEAQSIMENRNHQLGGNNIKLIPVQDDMSHIFLLNNALSDGQIVSIPNDRMLGSSKHVDCVFFGEKAKFPTGAYILSINREVPMIAVFVMKLSGRKYKILVRKIEAQQEQAIPKWEKISMLASCFASNLEDVVREYPTQWFNYFDFWKQ